MSVPPQPPPAESEPERYRPWALIGITLVALAGFAVFFLSFLVAPLAILLIFYVGFAASDRIKRNAKDRQKPADEPTLLDEHPSTAEPATTATPYRRRL